MSDSRGITELMAKKKTTKDEAVAKKTLGFSLAMVLLN
jgi:hypothetical protein